MPNPARRSLTRDEIVRRRAAGRRVGLHGMSMRLLGDELGVWPMAVYHHVRTRRRWSASSPNGARGAGLPGDGRLAALDSVEDWLTASVAQTRAARRLFLRYPGLAEFILSHRPTPSGLRIAESKLTGSVADSARPLRKRPGST